MSATAPALYLLALVLPWVLCVLCFKLQTTNATENLRLILYALTFVAAATATTILITTDEVVVIVDTSEPAVANVTGTGDGSNREYYAYEQRQAQYNVTLFSPDAGAGRVADAYLFAILYLGLTLLFLILTVSEVFRIAENMWTTRRGF